ncbi:MAG TPA: DUF4352 domain-containing protein, partial [Bryobacteraceae bacterium]|nr:DUF4352 domain-containing protein [Bryobacteraceae bacterium]
NKMYRMGDRAQAGPLVYTVLDTEWLDQLGDGPTARLPQNRFLAVRITVTNGGAATANVPPAILISASGTEYREVEDASPLPEWLGYIRSVNAADTLHGRMLFDAPPGDYQLRLRSGTSDPDRELAITVALPLQLGSPRIPAAAGAQQ